MRADVLVALGGDGHDHAPRAPSLSCRFDTVLSYTGLLRGDGDDGEALVDERDRAVLHLARRIGLGVQVADLLELERAFARRWRRPCRGPRKARSGRPCTPAAASSMAAASSQDALRPARPCRPAPGTEARIWLVLSLPFALRQQQGQQRERSPPGPRNDLVDATAISLFAFGVDDAVAFARQRGAHHVGDAEHLARPSRGRRARPPACRPSRPTGDTATTSVVGVMMGLR